MNKTAMKGFAVWARSRLIAGVKQRAFEYGIRENAVGAVQWQLTEEENRQRRELIDEIRRKGYQSVMEEAAYLWFNRFVALRFMEVNGFLPSRVRVFTDECGAFKPQILKEAMSVELEGLDRGKVLDLLDRQDNEGLYKYLLITQCNALNGGLPWMFGKISHWTELLFPDHLLKPDSVVGKMISDLDEEDFKEVEIIGWLYQFYISEKHEAVVDPLHGKIIKKEDIPAATQLFTTDWVVQYILDNSLGRYWLERHPESALADKLTYLVTPKDGRMEHRNESIAPEELKVLDPCVGSGHFLSYAFDVLMEIYRECGWSDRDAAKSILENNLYGLDIDDRAVQLACFAVTMKARKYHRRILNTQTTLHILAIQDADLLAGENMPLDRELATLCTVFQNAKEYGSALTVPELDYAALGQRLGAGEKHFLPLVRQAEILSGKYHIVATNPPYLNKYSPLLKAFLTRYFADHKGDLFSVFMFRCFGFCKENGYCGLMTPMVWMFIKTYEPLRRYILSEKSITTLVQLEYSAFEEATVPICAFVLKNGAPTARGLYFRLSAFPGSMEVQKQKVLEALEHKNCGYFYEADQSRFSGIPTAPIAYWLSRKFIDTFENETVGQVAQPRQGLATGCNEQFLRRWYEVSERKVCYDAHSAGEALESGKKWFPYNKGGEYRKWYGNQEYLVNWEQDGLLIRQFRDGEGRLRSRPQNTRFYFRECISWSLISSGTVAFRYKPYGQIFDVAGMSCFADRHLKYLLGLCNSPVALAVLAVLAPTINFQAGDIANIPVVMDEEQLTKVEDLVDQNIGLSKCDWDAFETSWDFKKHPLV